jgi:hypothetical protein
VRGAETVGSLAAGAPPQPVTTSAITNQTDPKPHLPTTLRIIIRFFPRHTLPICLS